MQKAQHVAGDLGGHDSLENRSTWREFWLRRLSRLCQRRHFSSPINAAATKVRPSGRRQNDAIPPSSQPVPEQQEGGHVAPGIDGNRNDKSALEKNATIAENIERIMNTAIPKDGRIAIDPHQTMTASA